MGAHLLDGKFQSDKYPWCARGFVPLKTSDKHAQPALALYAQAHRAKDAEFSADLEEALKLEGYDGAIPEGNYREQAAHLAKVLHQKLSPAEMALLKTLLGDYDLDTMLCRAL